MRFMSAVFLLSIFLSADAHLGLADLMVLQTIEDLQDKTTAGKEQITLYISGRRVRFDKGQSISSIILHDKKVTFSVDHGSRTYVVLPHNQIKADNFSHGAAVPSEVNSLDSTVIKLMNNTEKVSGYLCRRVDVSEKDENRTELWIARNALDTKLFSDEFKGFMEFGFPQVVRKLEKHPELHGMPIRVVEYNGSRMLRRATINRLETDSIPASVFEIPAGYSEIRMSEVAPPPASLVGEDSRNLKR